MNGPFLCQVHRVLESGGMLHFWTDVRDYFLEAMQVIANETPLDDLIVPEESPAHHDLDYRTHFERRVRKHGQTVYRALYRKE